MNEHQLEKLETVVACVGLVAMCAVEGAKLGTAIKAPLGTKIGAAAGAVLGLAAVVWVLRSTPELDYPFRALEPV